MFGLTSRYSGITSPKNNPLTQSRTSLVVPVGNLDNELSSLHSKLRSERIKLSLDNSLKTLKKVDDAQFSSAIDLFKETGSIDSLIDSTGYGTFPYINGSNKSSISINKYGKSKGNIKKQSDIQSFVEGVQSESYEGGSILNSSLCIGSQQGSISQNEIKLMARNSEKFTPRKDSCDIVAQEEKLKKAEKKIEFLHVELQKNISKLNKQPAVKDEEGYVDTSIAGLINKSNALNFVSPRAESLNSKLLEEGIIKTSKSNKASLIKKHYKQIDWLNNIKEEKEDHLVDLQSQSLPSLNAVVQLVSKNNLDQIYNDVRQKERKTRVQKAQQELINKHKHPLTYHKSYNVWYVSPELRHLNKISLEEKQHPYAKDPQYLYNNIDQLEDLYCDNIFDAKLNASKQTMKSQKQKEVQHIRNMIANYEVIRNYTRQIFKQRTEKNLFIFHRELIDKGERIPLFMKQAVAQDSGKQVARSGFKNKYFSETQLP